MAGTNVFGQQVQQASVIRNLTSAAIGLNYRWGNDAWMVRQILPGHTTILSNGGFAKPLFVKFDCDVTPQTRFKQYQLRTFSFNAGTPIQHSPSEIFVAKGALIDLSRNPNHVPPRVVAPKVRQHRIASLISYDSYRGENEIQVQFFVDGVFKGKYFNNNVDQGSRYPINKFISVPIGSRLTMKMFEMNNSGTKVQRSFGERTVTPGQPTIWKHQGSGEDYSFAVLVQ